MSKKIKISAPKKKVRRDADSWVGANSTKRLTVDLPDEMHSDLKAAAARHKKTMSEVVIQMISKYIEKN